jgi:hypoxanthine phosphoribosyltransferase
MSGAPKASAAVEPLFSAEEIARRVEALADEIARGERSELLIVSVLTGGFVFAADLVRALHNAGVSAELDFMILASYGGEQTSSGRVAMLRDIEADVGGRSVLLLDDLVDTGRTLAFAKSLLEKRGARRVATCVLLDKAVARATPLRPDYKGFDCPPHFVVGYGMGHGHRYRELPYIGRIVHD